MIAFDVASIAIAALAVSVVVVVVVLNATTTAFAVSDLSVDVSIVVAAATAAIIVDDGSCVGLLLGSLVVRAVGVAEIGIFIFIAVDVNLVGNVEVIDADVIFGVFVDIIVVNTGAAGSIPESIAVGFAVDILYREFDGKCCA